MHSTLILAIILIGVSSASRWQYRENPKDRYKCVCPGFRRDICRVTPTGEIVTYVNLCDAKCKYSGEYPPLALGLRSDCKKYQLLPNHHSNQHEDSDSKYMEEWLQEIEKESHIWKKVNALMREIIQLSNGGAPPCICPSFQRNICTIGNYGDVQVYKNICVLLCSSDSYSVTGVGDFCGVNSTSKSIDKEDPFVEEEALEKWFKFMEKEVKFYRKVGKAMGGLFLKSSI